MNAGQWTRMLNISYIFRHIFVMVIQTQKIEFIHDHHYKYDMKISEK